MIEMPAVVGDVVRSVGLSTAMKAAGVVTGLLPIPQPMLLVGPGASRRLGQALAGFGHRKILVVTDKGVAKLGLAKAFLQALRKGGADYVVFDAVTADAPIPVIEKGIAYCQRRNCDAVVAFGGGSPMDAAKVIAYAVANRKHPRKLVGYFKGLSAPLPVYAVPTTAGTGSEVTVAAVISDPDEGTKLVIADTRLAPAMAALDPSLMTGLPRDITAATGMDALTHAVEAFIGQWATAYTDRMALAAVALIYENLPVACRNPRNLEARERMALAATYAGLAFTRANVGYVHAISHQLGGRYHTPHGLANAIMLPHVLRHLAPAVTKRLARLAVAAKVGGEGEKPAALARKFLASVEAMNKALGIPEVLETLREADIPALAKAACWEADTSYPVPKYMSPETCAGILRKVLPGAGRRAARPAKPRPRGRGSR
ncbi:MAG: iron-containing alcohol dehydrogenase [Burkholderiales bacterium]